MKIKAFLLTLFLVTTVINARDFDKAKMDSLFSSIENHDKGMGSVSIFEDGKEVYQKSYGYSDLEKDIKATSSTKYRIGSISKTFTATVIMKLIERGDISLSTPLRNFYPPIKNSDKITVEHLLQHRSGIANFTSAEDYMEWNTLKHNKGQLITKIVAGVANFAPGEKFEYSNSNYVLLTFIAEEITGRSFSVLLNQFVLQPCGLKDTYVGSKINPAVNEAYSYVKLSEWKREKETDMSIPLGAGFIVSTPTDLNKFLYNLFAGKIVSNESLNKMTSLKDNFGLGLFKVPFHDMTGYGHTGGIDGFHSNAFYFPDSKVSIALTENGMAYPLNDIIVGALSIYFGKEYSLPQFSEAISLNAEDLDKYLGVYSTSTFPLKLTITKDGNTLIAQGTGQPSFPLEYIGENKFKFDAAKLELEFFPDSSKMILKQGGMTFEMTREE